MGALGYTAGTVDRGCAEVRYISTKVHHTYCVDRVPASNNEMQYNPTDVELSII